MAMNIDYTGIKNSIASTLVADPRFDKTNIAARYVRQVLKQRWSNSGPFPIVLIYLDSKSSEQHLTIGYSPYPVIRYTIKTLIQYPPNKDSDGNSEVPAALLAAIGETVMQRDEVADAALEKITDSIEEILRGNNTTLKANRYLNNDQIKVALPESTQFNFLKGENEYYIFSDISVRVEMRLTGS